MFLESSKKKGSIEVICGSMFSGKTEELIRRVKRAHFANLKVEIFKPLIDTRYHHDEIASHDENSLPSTAVNTAAEILLYAANAEVVAIDEAQFFDNGIVEVANQLANRGCRVIIAGLDMNYLGEPFGPMPHLMAVAEYVTKVHAICTKCGDLANHSHRTIGGDQLVLLGEKESYQPLCRECFNKT